MKENTMRKLCITAIVLTLALPTSAMAIEWSLSAGAGIAPDYEGSDDYEPVPLWNLQAKDLYHPKTYVQLKGTKLNSNFLPSENWRLGLSGQYIGERNDVDNNKVDNLSKTDSGVMIGIMGGYDFNVGKGVLGLEVDGRFDTKDEIGGLVTLRAKYKQPIRDNLVFSAGVDSTYATDDYMDEFFSVGAADSARSGLSTYSADAGFKDIGLQAALTYKFTPSWSVTGLGRYARLIGDAEDSPVVKVGSENQFIGGVLVGFSF
jgi:outer membrane protein